jgi:acetyltransferase-like isoleucine patch superfamily enzyme
VSRHDDDAGEALREPPLDRFHRLIVGSPTIGEGTWIGPFTVIDGSGGLTIGKGCDISAGAHIYTHSTLARCLSARRHDVVDRRPTEIGDYVHIGANATILMGARIGDHCAIGAGAVVLEGMEVPPYSIVVGVPGRVLEGTTHKWVDG